MPSPLTLVRVFIASPGGLGDERKAIRDEVQECNDADAVERGVLFQAVGWEDTLGGVGRPQTLINEDIRKADYFVLMLWNRWGSSPDSAPSSFSSATQEEYELAMQCFERKSMRQIVLFFKAVDLPQLSDPGPQLQKVLDFKKELEQNKAHLFHSFDTGVALRKLIRKHLAAWLRGEQAAAPLQSLNPPEHSAFPGRSPGAARQGAGGQLPSSSAEAWSLADEGRLTDAEVQFARNVVDRRGPEPLLEYGRFLHRVGRLAQAQVMFEGAVTAAEDQRDEETLAAAYADRGIILRLQGELTGAEEMAGRSLEISERLGLHESAAGAYCDLGAVLEIRGDLQGAERMYRQSLELNERVGCREGMANAYASLAKVLQIRGDLDGAEKMCHKSLEISDEIAHVEGRANVYGTLGKVLQSRHDLDGAERMHQEALAINERLGRLEGMADAYGNLGNVLQARGDLDGGEEMYRRSLDVNERLGRLEGVANAYGNLGITLQMREDLDGAERMYRKSLGINERLGRSEGMANAYGNLGTLLQERGDLEGAEQMHRKSLEINSRLCRLEGMASDYGNLGMVMDARGNLDASEQMYMKALALAEQVRAPDMIARVKSLLAILHQGPVVGADGTPAGA